MKNRGKIDRICEILRILAALEVVGEGKYPDGWSSHEIARHSEMSISSVQRTLRTMRDRGIVEASIVSVRGIEIFNYYATEQQIADWCGKAMF